MLGKDTECLGLCQGATTSPMLAVLGLAYVIQKASYSLPNDVVCKSYVDDITILGPREADFEDLAD